MEKKVFMSSLLVVLLALLAFSSQPLCMACTDNGQCGPDEYCAKTVGDCDGQGVCESKPQTCPPLYDPVCGCDGKSYSNPCEAARAGVNIAYLGVCDPSGCTDNGECGPDDYCAKAIGDCEGQGICTPKPTTCEPIWDPVCGCDGQTYGNECYAAMAGVNVDYPGECQPYCTDNGECGPDDYCAKAQGDCNGQGTCTMKPTTCQPLYDPVCGCDGQTYGNECYAAMAGVNVDYTGVCAECVNPPVADIAGNDCKVDMKDVAKLAEEWLTCGLNRQDLCWE